MRYYLDFDRTVFDTDAFSEHMKGRPDGPSGEEEVSFASGELARFLYPDAAAFLREKENAATIIASGDPASQESKMKSALYGIPRVAVMYTGDVQKGLYLAPHTHLHQDAVLADGSPSELELLARTCPALGLFEVRRDGTAGDGRWPVVRTLAELP